MFADASLDAGLLVGTDHELVGFPPGEVALAKGGVVFLPAGGQPHDVNGRQPSLFTLLYHRGEPASYHFERFGRYPPHDPGGGHDVVNHAD